MERDEYERMAVMEETMWWYRVLHLRLAEAILKLDLSDGSCLLDAGCGTGGFIQKLQKILPHIRLTGLEMDIFASNICKGKTSDCAVNGNVNNMPFLSEIFDVIVSSDVLYHRSVDEEAALIEFYRCLKKGGTLLLNLPAYDWMKSGHDKNIHTARRYTVKGVKKLLNRTGFEIKQTGYWNSLLFPVMMLWRLTVGRFEDSSDVKAFPERIDRLFYSIAATENTLAEQGIRFPFGGSVYAYAVKP